jgi:hypothetical protein
MATHAVDGGISIPQMVMRHDQILLTGEPGTGLPGLTTRMLAAETTLASIRFYARWLVLLVGGIFVTTVVNLIVKR